ARTDYRPVTLTDRRAQMKFVDRFQTVRVDLRFQRRILFGDARDRDSVDRGLTGSSRRFEAMLGTFTTPVGRSFARRIVCSHRIFIPCTRFECPTRAVEIETDSLISGRSSDTSARQGEVGYHQARTDYRPVTLTDRRAQMKFVDRFQTVRVDLRFQRRILFGDARDRDSVDRGLTGSS